MSYERDRKSLHAINIGLGANIILAIVKTTIGVLGHSPALLAEGINSTSDVAYYIAASIFVRMANQPADSDHPYGHRQFESIGSLLIGAFVVTTALAIFWDAVDKVWDFVDGAGDFTTSQPLALYVALVTVLIKIFLTFYIRRLGRETQNHVVVALAYDHRNDLFSAAAASMGIFLGQRGLPWVDPLAGAFVALVIFRTGLFILRESSTDLMAVIPSHDLARQISDLLSNIHGVIQLEEVQAHLFGPHIVLNLTIGMDGALSVSEGDHIASQVEETLLTQISNVRRVHVHYHPARPEHANRSIEDMVKPAKKSNPSHHPEYYE